MKDLQSLIGHPSVAGFEKLQLCTGRPITLIRNGEQKNMGNPLNNQQLHALLKASTSAEVMSGFQWGKELNTVVSGCDVRIVLRPEKVIQVVLMAPVNEPDDSPGAIPLAEPTSTSQAPPPMGSNAEEVVDASDDPAVADEVARLTDAENTALIYAPGEGAEGIASALEGLGYPTKITASADATIEVLKYHDYPIFTMFLGAGFARDKVYSFLVQQNMELRRKQYSILVTPSVETGNTLHAFTLSVNYIVAASDIASMEPLLEKAIIGWKRFVGPLHDYLKEAGRL